MAGGRDDALSSPKLFAPAAAARVIFLHQAGGPVLQFECHSLTRAIFRQCPLSAVIVALAAYVSKQFISISIYGDDGGG